MLKYSSIGSLLVFLLFSTAAISAQKTVKSGAQAAGFSFSTDSTVVEPIVHYQQKIQMLSSYADQPSVSVFGDGRVLVHYPRYMKKSGDYVMQLDAAELENVIQTLSNNGMMTFDEKKVKAKVKADKKSLQTKGELFAISDAVITDIEIKLDQYQRDSSSRMQTDFSKHFKWKNIEHDVAHYKNNAALIKANNSVKQLKKLMSDTRLVNMKR